MKKHFVLFWQQLVHRHINIFRTDYSVIPNFFFFFIQSEFKGSFSFVSVRRSIFGFGHWLPDCRSRHFRLCLFSLAPRFISFSSCHAVWKECFGPTHPVSEPAVSSSSSSFSSSSSLESSKANKAAVRRTHQKVANNEFNGNHSWLKKRKQIKKISCGHVHLYTSLGVFKFASFLPILLASSSPLPLLSFGLFWLSSPFSAAGAALPSSPPPLPAPPTILRRRLERSPNSIAVRVPSRSLTAFAFAARQQLRRPIVTRTRFHQHHHHPSVGNPSHLRENSVKTKTWTHFDFHSVFGFLQVVAGTSPIHKIGIGYFFSNCWQSLDFFVHCGWQSCSSRLSFRTLKSAAVVLCNQQLFHLKSRPQFNQVSSRSIFSESWVSFVPISTFIREYGLGLPHSCGGIVSSFAFFSSDQIRHSQLIFNLFESVKSSSFGQTTFKVIVFFVGCPKLPVALEQEESELRPKGQNSLLPLRTTPCQGGWTLKGQFSKEYLELRKKSWETIKVWQFFNKVETIFLKWKLFAIEPIYPHHPYHHHYRLTRRPAPFIYDFVRLFDNRTWGRQKQQTRSNVRKRVTVVIISRIGLSVSGTSLWVFVGFLFRWRVIHLAPFVSQHTQPVSPGRRIRPDRVITLLHHSFFCLCNTHCVYLDDEHQSNLEVVLLLWFKVNQQKIVKT